MFTNDKFGASERLTVKKKLEEKFVSTSGASLEEQTVKSGVNTNTHTPRLR